MFQFFSRNVFEKLNFFAVLKASARLEPRPLPAARRDARVPRVIEVYGMDIDWTCLAKLHVPKRGARAAGRRGVQIIRSRLQTTLLIPGPARGASIAGEAEARGADLARAARV